MSVRQAGYVGHVGQWGPQPVNQGAVFGRRPQEPEEHPGMQQSWASPVITGPGAPASPIRGQSQDLEMQSAWAAGTVSARDAPLTNAQHSGASGVTGPSAPIPASQEEAAKAAWLTKNGGSGTRDAAPNVASDPASPWGRAGGSAWYGGQVAAGPATRHTTPGDGQMHAAWGALNVQNRGGAPQSKFTENEMLGPGSNYYPR
jgi:hypothetical protein